jgi:hypothetical protein
MKSLACLAALALTAILVPSAHAADRTRPLIVAQSTPEVCAEIYQPVCGTDAGGKRVTYSNACFARAAKATAVTPGECSK